MALLHHQDVFAGQRFHQETGQAATSIDRAKYCIANEKKNDYIPGYGAN